MRNDGRLQSELETSLQRFEATNGLLPGIATLESRNTFVKQIIDSIKRVDYVGMICARDIAPQRADPYSSLFDPLKAAILQNRQGNLDEACWLTFLSIHCGKHKVDGWKLVQTIYANEDGDEPWSWFAVTNNIGAFRESLEKKRALKSATRGRFGNHRRYESLAGYSEKGTGAAVESYSDWVNSRGGHSQLFIDTATATAGDPAISFDHLYQEMRKNVTRFSRLGSFDFLCMLGKLGLADITPGNPYLRGSTGPLRGAKLLTSIRNVRTLDQQMTALGQALGVHMQVIEDSLCNWQKNPSDYEQFRG